MNIYYNPEKFGLKILATLNTGWSYQFDTTILFKDKSGCLFVAHDAGCSCPTPFEDMGVSDLIPIQNRRELRKYIEEQHYELPPSEAMEFLNKFPNR